MNDADDPRNLTPRELAQRYLDRRQIDAADETLRTYRKRLQHFVEWCEEQDIQEVRRLSGWHVDQFETARRSEGVSPVTLKGELSALRLMLQYGERIEAVDDDLAEKVDPPTLSKEEESSDTKLASGDAVALLRFYRDEPGHLGQPYHACFELAWNTGARLGSLIALDREDFYPDEQYVEFLHRPETGTPLKNDEGGQRPVSIPEPVLETIEYYVARERPKKRDEHGREPLFATRQGRASRSTIRGWIYGATQPCVRVECPHGKRRAECEWTERNYRSKCPSSRSPHQIRTGSISWQLDQGIPLEVVSDRADVSPDVIRRHYDKSSELQKMENRRRQHVAELDIDDS